MPEKISKSKLQLIASLKQKKKRSELGLFVVEGMKCFTDTINTFQPFFIVASDEWIGKNRSIADRYGNVIFTASAGDLNRISSLSTAPDIMAVYRIPLQDENEWTKGIDRRLTLVLDEIQDPGNLGTIIRAADWFGVHYIAASPTTVDLYNAKTIQSTMGAISRVKLIYTDLIKLLKQHKNLPVYGTLLDGENIYDAELENHGFIVFGNEGNGISETIRTQITDSLLIPSYPSGEATSESLNVAMAASITLAEFRRRVYDTHQ